MSDDNNTSNIHHGHLSKIVEAADAGDISSVHSVTNDLLSLCSNTGKSPATNLQLPDSIITNLQKVYCRSLIGLSKYENVLKFYDSLVEQENKILFLQERAYALYKLGRYASCRDFILQTFKERTMNPDETMGQSLAFILAQCYFRLNDTEKAVQLYSDLVGDEKVNVEEETYVLTNALAALSANNAVTVSNSFVDKLQKNVMKVMEHADSMALMEYPYEMMYNYATLLLQTSTSMRQTRNALTLLSTAEEKCLELSQETIDGAVDIVDDDLLLIQANMALGKTQSGDLNGALRSYLDLTSSLKKRNDSTTCCKKLCFVADNNIASIQQHRGSSSLSAFDLLKKIPDPSNMSSMLFKEGEPLANPHQIRILLYNRAILYFKLGKLAEMKSTLECLKKSMAIDTQVKIQGESKKKKKHNGGSSKGSSGGKSIAVPMTRSERLFWQCRIALLDSEVSKDDEKLRELQNAIDVVLKDKDISQFEKEVLDCAKAEIQLYKAQKNVGDSNEMSNDAKKSLIASLEDLPESIKSRPATVASLCSLYRSMDMNDKVEACLNASSQSEILRKNLAAFKLRLGMYEDAASIYESILESAPDLSYEDKMECQAGLVKSLSHINIEKTIELAKDFKFLENDDDISIDGEELEAMEIPRLSQGSKGGTHLRHILIARKQQRYVCDW